MFVYVFEHRNTHVHAHSCTCAHVCVCAYVSARVRAFVHLSVCVSLSVAVCAHAGLYGSFMRVCFCMKLYEYTGIQFIHWYNCKYICMHVHVHVN